jgi:hypothetical protein
MSFSRIDVKVITDSGELGNANTCEDGKALLNAGTPVKINRHKALMHIKQDIIDNVMDTTPNSNLH